MVGGESRDADQGAVAEIPLVVDADLNEASALCRKLFVPGQRFVDGPRAGFGRKRKRRKVRVPLQALIEALGGLSLSNPVYTSRFVRVPFRCTLCELYHNLRSQSLGLWSAALLPLGLWSAAVGVR